MDLPDDIQASLVDSVGAYIRATPTQDLPGRLRRFKGWRPKALQGQRAELLPVLDDEVERKKILKWMSDGKVPVRGPEAELLRIACERVEGWEAELERRSKKPRSAPDVVPPTSDAMVLEDERAKVRVAKDEARRARREGRAAADLERRRANDLTKEMAQVRERLVATEQAVTKLRAEAKATTESLDRERRRLTREVERVKRERDELKATLKEARREQRSLERHNKELERQLDRRPSSGAMPRPKKASSTVPADREPLPVPAGLFDDSPESLSAWLDAAHVTLLVDGYNVAKAEEAYGQLDLPAQRTRLVDEVDRLARRHGASATIVFDGAKIAPGLSRRRRHGVSVVYSKPPESADDHLVAMLEELPNHPVIVVTSDRELRDRVAEKGATLAYSAQLLALIR